MRILKVLLLTITPFIIIACDNSNNDVSPTSNILVVKCSEPIPEFTLGQNSNPSNEQVTALCSCIWKELGDWGRKSAKAMSEGKSSELSFIHKNGFSSKFGESLRKCGGMEL